MSAQTETYTRRRSQLEVYFDRTAADAWAKLTSDAPVSKIRATVRAGRDEMRAMLLDWLPADLSGRRLLDAGCGTGALAVEAARRGAEVTAIDISPSLIALANERSPKDLGAGRVDFRVGDMLDATLGQFDHVVAMDSLIHYRADDVVRALDTLSGRVDGSILYTFAPRTPLLSAMHIAGKVFPRGNRSQAIVPHGEADLRSKIGRTTGFASWQVTGTHRVTTGFYISQAMKLERA